MPAFLGSSALPPGRLPRFGQLRWISQSLRLRHSELSEIYSGALWG